MKVKVRMITYLRLFKIFLLSWILCGSLLIFFCIIKNAFVMYINVILLIK